MISPDSELQTSTQRLAEIVEHHHGPLLKSALGKRFAISQFRFVRIAYSRNAIYRIEETEHRWFLKIPRVRQEALVRNESLGARMMLDCLAQCDHYQAPKMVVSSMSPSFFLASQVEGKYLGTLLYRAIGRSRNSEARSTAFQGYDRYGRILATIHRDGPRDGLAPPTTMPIMEKYEQAASRVKRPDKLHEELKERMQEFRVDSEPCFVHGNLRKENVLYHQGRVGIIDFETCGVGSRYEDLAFASNNLIMPRAAAFFPWRIPFAAWSELIRGYREVFPFDPIRYREYLVAHLATSYAWLLGDKRVTVSGIPVTRKRLASTIQRVINQPDP